MSSTSGQKLNRPIQRLYDACKASEENLYAASQQMQNRGLKFLFKGFAQQHSRYADQLAELAQQIGFTLSSPGRFRRSLQRGWMDIRIAMIVGRANRQAAAASRCEAGQHKLLETYDDVLRMPLPEVARVRIQEQRGGAQGILRWLQRIGDQKQWIIRLYDDSTEAVRAVEALVDAGLNEKHIEVTPLNEIVMYQDDSEEPTRSTVDATLVGGLTGVVFGILAGLLIGYAVPLFVRTVPVSQTTLVSSLLIWGLIGAVVGASFGSFFGLLLGRGLSEDDAFLIQATPELDAIVVCVQTTEETRTDAARILQMRHQRELESVPSQHTQSN
jgi:uncharacterized protein (TIGR02284 family)